MNIPNFTAIAEQIGRLSPFEKAIRTLEDGLANKHIWNVDFAEAKERLGRIAEEAMKKSSEAYRNANRGRMSWDSSDPRWGIVYHPQFFNTPGAFKNITKRVNSLGKESPDFYTFLTVLGEIAQVAELVKAVKPYIEKGRKPSDNPKEVDYTNTGLCSVCGHRQKLNLNGTLVAHGYTLERNWGGRAGICYGTGYKAWELAPDGAIEYKVSMVQYLENTESYLAKLKAGEFEELEEMVEVRVRPGVYKDERRVYAKGTEEYSKVLNSKIGKASQTIDYLHNDIEMFTERIESWKPQPLKYGGAETQERWKSKLLAKA